MRGLDRASRAATGTAAAGLAAAGLLVAGCSTGGAGVRDEGAARSGQVAKVAPTTTPSSEALQMVDAVSLVKNDPEVSEAVKRDLKPCVADEYPVDVSYGKITANGVNDVVVNVLSCADAVGVGTYVYRAEGETYENVFAAEEPPVYAEIDRGDLVLTKQVYAKGDSVAFPSGEDIITYRWSGEKFTEVDRVHNDYSNAVDGGAQPPAAPSED
ncbi:hypothetical protein NLX86_30910 [Streptomyces sp. A3M-1-3]|uniref:hypothetical protein n=1 Tax=Streptomyces sp. A3M-1-3 TaxID=2962044 RepID=UPI0020B6F8A1|nr:hypothetical protein [Streptomyces sp. A3M-1-3]MCP3822337.1 hypothetical protein [Streptomyces sp. A3M-1-3]